MNRAQRRATMATAQSTPVQHTLSNRLKSIDTARVVHLAADTAMAELTGTGCSIDTYAERAATIAVELLSAELARSLR